MLVVEDNAGDRWFFSEVLRSRGYTVISCETGETAWESFLEKQPALIILDLMLPGIDGVELCRRIREHPRGWEPVIVAVTGREDPDALNTILAAGADNFVRKPVGPPLLEIRLAIAERRLADQQARRRTQEQLEAKSRELETLFENLHDVFFSVDVEDGRLIQVSPAARQLFGHAPDELIGNPDLWTRYILPATEEEDPWASLREDPPREPLVREYPVERPDGTVRWVRANVKVELDESGRAIRADGTVVDSTQEWRAHQELALRNKELAALYRLSELTLTATSLEEAYKAILEEIGRVMGCPVVAIEHLNRERDSLVVTASRGLPETVGPVETPLHKTLSGKAVESRCAVVETDLQARNDHEVEVHRSLSLRSYAAFPLAVGRNVVGTLALASPESLDMDERFVRLGSNLANTLATFVERLEAAETLRDNERRYRKLAGQLRQANQQLESFAYSVSHDLRAPLRTMQGFAHALLQNFADSLDPEARDYAERIIASGQQSEELIRDLLTYSRLSFEKLDLKSVELDSVVDAALEQVQADLEAADADVDVDEDLPVALANQTTLVQVLANLLSNAVKFVPDGRKPSVRIRAEKRDERVRLWVEDNGIGVPEGQEERIFRVFERLAESGDRPGTGIGLAVVRRRMERIGGECGVEPSPAEEGSAFWIEMDEERRADRSRWSLRG